MNPHLEEEQKVRRIPLTTRWSLKPEKQLGSRSSPSSDCVSESTLSALSAAKACDKPGELFAPGLQSLKSKFDAHSEQRPSQLDPDPAGGLKRKLEEWNGNSLTADISTKPTKTKPSILKRQRILKSCAVRTNTQRRVRFLPDVRSGVDEDTIEPSSSQKKLEEPISPLLRKRNVSANDHYLTPGTGTEQQLNGPASIFKGQAKPSTRNDPISNERSRGLNSVPICLDKFFQVVTTRETRSESPLPSVERKERKPFKTQTSETTSPALSNCEPTPSQSRYSTLPAALKRPELISSLATVEREVSNNADQAILAFAPSVGHGCAGPVCEAKEMEVQLQTPGVPCCEPSSKPPQIPAHFVESYVEDSQDDSDLEDFDAFHTVSRNIPSDSVDHQEQLCSKRLFPAEGSQRPRSKLRRPPFTKRSQEALGLDPKCTTDADSRKLEGSIAGRNIQAESHELRPVDALEPQITVGDFWPGALNRGEYGVLTPTTPMTTKNVGFPHVAQFSKSFPEDLVQVMNAPDHLEYEHNKSHVAADAKDCASVLKGEAPRNAFQTGRGNPVQISSSAYRRVQTIFDDASPRPETRVDVNYSGRGLEREVSLNTFQTGSGKPVQISSSAFLRVQSMFDDVFPSPETRADVNANDRTLAKEGPPNAFQTSRGNPVQISSSASRRVQSIQFDDMIPSTETPIDGVDREMGHERGVPRNAFQTGGGNPIPISSSALRRVQSMFDEVSPSPGAKVDFSVSSRFTPRNKRFAASSVLADPHSLLSVRKNLYSDSLSAQDVDNEEPSLVYRSKKTSVEGKTACLFQTGRGAPVLVSSESIRRVHPIFSELETSEVVRVPLSSTGEAISPLDKNISLRAQQSFLVTDTEIPSGAAERAKSLVSSENFIHAGKVPVTRSNLFRTGRDTPLSISSSSMKRILSMFDDDELTPPPSNGVEGATTPGPIGEEGSTSSPSHFTRVRSPSTNRAGERSRELPSRNSDGTVLHKERLLEAATPLPSFLTGSGTKEFGLKLKRSPGEVELRERANFIRYKWDRIFEPRLGFSVEGPGDLENTEPTLLESGLAASPFSIAGRERTTSKFAFARDAEGPEDCPPESRERGFSFRGSSGRTLRISSAAKAKAEALLKLGPEFVTPPKFESRRPSYFSSTKASDFITKSSVDARKFKPSSVNHVDLRKEVFNGEIVKLSEEGLGGGLGTKPGFKSPRLIRPLSSVAGRLIMTGDSRARIPAPRRICLLPKSLDYLHQRETRNARCRLQMREYFGRPPYPDLEIRDETRQAFPHLSKEILYITADSAEDYRIPGLGTSVGAEDMWEKLKELGADHRYAGKGWVANHFKWIVWKLASYDRKYPRQAAGHLLSVSSVLNELKYRYDRELNGERSALKRVTERDASSGHTMVLCVSAIRSVRNSEHLYEIWTAKGDNGHGSEGKSPPAGVIEVTDGWYRLNAHIDGPLARRIHSGKLKTGQKIVVCGATLGGLSDGLPPLQAFSTAYLTINANGVRRARWDERLGFCGTATPLAFKHIAHDGGVVPHTYIAITRKYPVLHREKLAGGGYIVRSDRAEDMAARNFDQRRAKVAQCALQKLENSRNLSDEGAELYASLETAADPESLMLDMTRTQLDAFTAFKARKEESMQASAGDWIRDALDQEGLTAREVTPTFKIRVVGLNRKGSEASEQDGIVTIWHATEELQEQLQEGKVFCVYGLRPSTKDSYHSFNSTRWRLVSGVTLNKRFEFPYVPRAPLRISDVSENMPHREFDVTGLVLYITEPVNRDLSRGRSKYQWVFMTDGSCAKGDAADAWEETQVLAVEVCWPEQAFVPLESSLVGSVVGYCNLWLKHRDQSNRLWVAEASDRAVYSTKMTSPAFRHLTSAACEVQTWAKSNSWNVDILQADVMQLALHV